MPHTIIGPAKRNRAKQLRRDMTGCEKKLWAKLKAHRSGGAHFRRQVPIGPYVADFVCNSAKLIVEVDGDQHAFGAQLVSDTRRDAWFAGQGYRTLRFSNWQVLHEFEGVLLTVEAALSGALDAGAYSRSSGVIIARDAKGEDASLPSCGGEMERGIVSREAAAAGLHSQALTQSPPSQPSPTRGEGSRALPSNVSAGSSEDAP